MEKIDNVAKLKELIASETKTAAQEHFAAIREENEAKGKELRESVEKQIAAARTQASERERLRSKGNKLAQIIRAFAGGRGDATKAAAYAEKNGMDEAVVKALATSPGSDGGYIVPPGYSADLIELLYNRVAVRQLGAVSVPMPNGNLTIPKLTAGITATYIGENQGQNSQQQTLGVVSLSWKKLRATVPISNDLIRFSSPRADDLVRNDMTNAFAVGEDAAFLRGTGAGNSPKGVASWIPAAHSNPVTDPTGASLSDTIADLLSLPRLLEEANIPFVSPGFVFSPRTKYYLMGLRDATGNLYFMDEMRRGTLLGYPFVSTNQVPSNLGGGSDESVIYYGDWNDALIGEADNLMLDVSNEASYKDSGGNLVSAFDLDQTVIRGISRHDFVVRREESFAELTGLQWGA